MYSIRSTLAGHKRSSNGQEKVQSDLVPILFARIRTRLGKPKPQTIRILLDSGASASIFNIKYLNKLRLKHNQTTTWITAAGNFTTSRTTEVQFTMPELYDDRVIEWKVHVAKDTGVYDAVIGRDLLRELGITMNFKDNTVTWDDSTIHMRSQLSNAASAYFIRDSKELEGSTTRVKRILDAKYEKANLNATVSNYEHLEANEKSTLLTLLRKYETLFDGTLGKWTGDPYHIELKPNVTPYHARAFPIPRIHEQTLRNEVQRLCELGVLTRINHSEWGAPTFIIPKKDGSVRFISDFRELNKCIKRKPYPIPQIQDILLKLEGFKYATSLDLNMGYYHIKLSPQRRKLCTIVLPWGKYEYDSLPMGLCNSPDVFQEKISTLMSGLEFVRAYIDDLLIITRSSWEDHLSKIEEVLLRLADSGLKVNAVKSFFGESEVEYLGYKITRQGIQPVAKKIQAIQNLKPPTNTKQLRSFIGIVNYYRDMWIKRSHILAPLTKLVSKTQKFVWEKEQQHAFDIIKKVISKETLLVYPNFNETFQIHTDASHRQMGAVISQKGMPIAFWSKKLKDAQVRYTTTERELLSIVECLKTFRNILLGHKIEVFTDHKNLTYQQFNTERVMRWRLLLEEFGPTLTYIKGEHNIVADALSRLDLTEEDINTENLDVVLNFEEELPKDSFPLTYSRIAREQRKDKATTDALAAKTYTVKTFCGGDKQWDLAIFKDKIVIPKALQKHVVNWYHDQLCHPGMTRTELSITQHFYWKNLRKDVEKVCKNCHICQKTKSTTRKYGFLPPKSPEAEPWERLCVDLIGPYNIPRKGLKDLKLHAVTMIDPATGWFEMRQISSKHAYVVANEVELAWLTRYPRPSIITYDRGTEFMAEFSAMVKNDYGITVKAITTRNPQANAILERIHATIGNIIRTHQVLDLELDEEDPWSGILAAAMYATRATIHTTLRATPMQLVFGRDAVLNTKFEADWKYIRDRKQKLIEQNNKRENAKRTIHEYQIGNRVLVAAKLDGKYQGDLWDGPYVIALVNNNGTVSLNRGAYQETINIRRIKPYFS